MTLKRTLLAGLSALLISAPALAADLDPVRLTQHVKVLSDDAFEGRAPDTEGERKTVAYLVEQFKSFGLKPGGDLQTDGTRAWTQDVPLARFDTEGPVAVSVNVAGQTRTWTQGEQVAIRAAQTGIDRLTLKDIPIVFIGYGVTAPERNWDDFKGLDMKGKIGLVLINDPDFETGQGDFGGKAMTYYGRWTYKFEEAARQGAAGALIIHETEAAAYGWEVVQNSWGGPSFDLPTSEDPDPRLPFQGWIHGDVAKQIFSAAGLDLEQQRLAADQRGFKALPLGGTAKVAFKTVIREATSDNVVALLRGSERPDEAVVFMAHWDHLGRTFSAPDGDLVFNGAVDNATGTAGVLEIAEALAAADPKPKRSILFLLPTLEESGLIGSRYFAAHPTLPLKNLVAGINMDALPVRGRSKDFAVIGYGQSNLDAILVDVLKGQDRVAVPEPTPQAGFYFRSDHFNFARVGVPALYGRGGFDLREGGVPAGQAEAADYTARRYHKTGDEFDPAWDFSGTVEDIVALHEVGRRVADAAERPQWSPDSEFRAADETRMAAN